MEVILTHEHADFDAIASMVGLARLIPGAVPVLPMTVNANVREFLTLYGRNLPLRGRDEVDRGPVARAWIVDTAHPASIRGMTAATPRVVIDHHVIAGAPGQETAAEGDDVQPVGAAATLIVERLTTAGLTPTPIEATLLLLGIHEDTGSLRYAGTTPRDLRAAARLLEHGADLTAIDRFLGHALSEAGRAVLLDLADAAAAVDVGGHRIAVAAAAAPGFDDEVAPLATKLMDLLDPDALFIVVDVGAVLHMVGRSRSADIDAAAVARRLGGNGHARAAAASLRGPALPAAKQAILDALPGAVRPAALVGDIMSRGPLRTLAADLTVADAVPICRRYGHEGYPVVDGVDVLGITTRRELDRALHHHLGQLTVRQLVTGQGVTVSPADTVAELQRRMVTHHLSQVPVVAGSRLVGIVTRGDLLRLWSAREGRPGPAETIVDLADALAPPDVAAIRHVAAVARERGDRAFLVGGLPRDLVLGVPPGPDIDVVVEGDAVALAHAVAARVGGTVTAHARFGTAKWHRPDGAPIDLVGARTEHYASPTALPTVERGSLRSDLERRDFTINTLAVDVDPDRFGTVIDLFNGLDDLRAGVIRTLHPLSFVEDPTRLLRAVRFEARFGFRMDPATAGGVPGAVGLLERVSGARIRAEILQLFAERDPAAVLRRLEALGALDAVSRGLTAGTATERRLDALPAAWSAWRRVEPGLPSAPGPGDRLILWLAEQGAIGAAAAARLGLSGRMTGRLHALIAVRAAAALGDPAATPSMVAAELAGRPPESVALAWLTSGDPIRREHLWRHARQVTRLAHLITGEDLIALGEPPGPRMGAVLDAVRAAQLDGRATDRPAALALARSLLRDPA